MNITSTKKAFYVCLIFVIAGIVGWKSNVLNKLGTNPNIFKDSIPSLIFYITITINTFFSIKLFSRLIPVNNILQWILDILLVLLYVTLGWNLGNQTGFIFCLLLLFITATAKYTFLLNIIDHPRLLKRKILVDLSGVLACSLTMGGVISGHANLSIWIFTIAFILANLLLFFVWELYLADFEIDPKHK